MEPIPWRRLLREGTRPDDVRATAGSAGWRLEREYPPDDEGRPLELVWTLPTTVGDVHYLHDTWAVIDYLYRGTGDLHEVTDQIDAVFDVVEESEMAKALSSLDPAARSWGVMAIVLSQARVLPEALERTIQAGLHDPDARVRFRTATAAGYTEDVHWVGVLEAVAAEDPDPAVVEEALRIAEGLSIG